ncbi:MAG TPA: class I SAM-dependent methyltransferase [Bryobacteraceae bacterium]|jgi:methyltransferase (TIGR00027 family)|nr:class I SAM-dependent methyltransferase [Bryobacteraceae bacterium]
METGQPSRTAWGAAFHRAAHQVLDPVRIFEDPLAIAILGQDTAGIARLAFERDSDTRMRAFIAVRTRFAEDALAAACDRGTTQLVVLGAGLDTYAYRGAMRERLRIWEVDHPATQAWKRGCLSAAGIALPANLTFASVDFEHETLADGLAAAGFDPSAQTFFTWLGVVPYLTREAIWSTLDFIAKLPGGAGVVFDYADPPDSLSAELRAAHERRAARVAQLGEAFRSSFEPEELRAGLVAAGFREVENLGPPGIVARYFPERAGPIPERGGHVVRASTV